MHSPVMLRPVLAAFPFLLEVLFLRSLRHSVIRLLFISIIHCATSQQRIQNLATADLRLQNGGSRSGRRKTKAPSIAPRESSVITVINERTMSPMCFVVVLPAEPGRIDDRKRAATCVTRIATNRQCAVDTSRSDLNTSRQ